MSSLTPVPELILDAWPILEWLKGREPAVWLIRGIIDDALDGRSSLSMCPMNYGEVIYSIRKSFPAGSVESALKAFREIPIRVDSIDDSLIDDAVELKATYPISYADAFAAALAMRRNFPLVPGDKEFMPLKSLGLKLHWVGA